MEVTVGDLTAHALSSPIEPPQERSFHGGVRRLHKRDVVLVVLEDRTGNRGFAPAGASSSAMREHFEGASQQDFAALVGTDIADRLVGETIDLTDERALLAAIDVPDPLGSQIAGAIDVAGFDLIGKRRGTPVHALLRTAFDADERGASDPDTPVCLPLYASAGMYMEPKGYAEQAGTIEACGFEGYKYRPGIGPDADRETVVAIDGATGDDFDVMVDAHTWWKLGDAAYSDAERDRVIDAYADHDVLWLEEPVEPGDHVAYASLARSTSVPLAGGESEPNADGLIELAEHVTFLQGDVRHHAGYAGCWRAAAACRDRDTRFVPHHFGTELGLIANAHLVAAIGGTLLEYPVFEGDPNLTVLESAPLDDPGMYPNPLAFDILADDLPIVDGTLTLPDGPGLGVTVDTDCIDDYPFLDGAWTEFEYA